MTLPDLELIEKLTEEIAKEDQPVFALQQVAMAESTIISNALRVLPLAAKNKVDAYSLLISVFTFGILIGKKFADIEKLEALVKEGMEHGTPMKCPTCGTPGHLDTKTSPGKESEFKDSIWQCPDGTWDCWYCWSK